MVNQAIQQYLSRNKYSKLNPKAVFFDMDGVLFDSMPKHAVAWVKAMEESNLPFTEEEAYLFEGQLGVDTVNFAYRRTYGRDSTEDERNAIYALKGNFFQELGEAHPMPFVYDLLKMVKTDGFRRFVVTGSGHRPLIQAILTSFPGIFEEQNIISSFDIKRGKPNPDPYLEALRRAGLEPWEALVIENAPLGVQASFAAQIFTLGVNTGPLAKNTLLKNGADIELDSMYDLYQNWKKIIAEILSLVKQ